jgi:hypothetical protein
MLLGGAPQLRPRLQLLHYGTEEWFSAKAGKVSNKDINALDHAKGR